MSLEDAMKFWRGEFTQRTDVDVDKFEKEYAYGIRYNYGTYRFQYRASFTSNNSSSRRDY
jgi:hypothetical protein